MVGNGTQQPYGYGGGVWRPDGSAHKTALPTKATVIIADIPAGTWTPSDAGPDSSTDGGPTEAGTSDSAAADGPTADAPTAADASQG